MIYSFLFITIFAASFASLDRKFPTAKAYFFACLWVIFLVAFRYDSVDYYSYFRIYKEIGSYSNFNFFIYHVDSNTPIEAGFALLILMEKALTGSFYFFLAFFALVSLIIKFHAFKKMSPYLILSLLIYISDEYFWKDMGQMRNAMASGIVLWALYYGYFRNYKFFLILVLLASLFHAAALITLPLYFAWYVRGPIYLLFALVFSLLVVLVWGGISSLLVSLAHNHGISENMRLIKYIDSQYAEGASAFGGTFLLHLFISILLISNQKRLVAKWPLNNYFIPIYVYGVCLFYLFIDYGIVSGRIRDMVIVPVSCVILPTFLLLFKNTSRVFPLSIITAYCVIWFYIMLNNHGQYKSIIGGGVS